MAFEKPKVQPKFADLKAILSQTQLDNTSYQLLQTLIDRLGQYQIFLTDELATKGAGEKGDKGDPGTSITIKGSVPDSGDLPTTGNEEGDGWITADDGHLWVWDGDSWVDAGLVQGPPGAQGPIGPPGPTGPASTVPGPQGPAGPTGATGATGAQGIPGPTGPTGATGSQGPQGPIGNTGAQGIQGVPGAAGERWFSGAGGPQPDIGQITGDWYLNTTNGDVYECTNGSTNTWVVRANIKGPKGDTGAQGPAGPAVGPHQATHQRGGADELLNNAWTNFNNEFIADQNIVKTEPALFWVDTSQPSTDTTWRILNSNKQLHFIASNRPLTINYTALIMDKSGTLTVTGNLTAGGTVTGSTGGIFNNTVTISGARAAVFQHSAAVQTHWKDTSQPTAQQAFSVINSAQVLYIVPTDGSLYNPVYGEYDRSISINRDGQVRTGNGGLYVNKINAGGELSYGTYTPVASGISLVSGFTIQSAVYIRVGRNVTVSGSLDVTVSGAGWVGFLLSLPIGTSTVLRGAASVLNYPGAVISQASGNPSYANFTWYTTTVGVQTVYYTYTYVVA